jgi:hypothetical protein
VPADQLDDRRHVTLILRLVVERDGALVYGEVLTVDAESKGRFATWQSMPRVISAALTSAE